MATVMLESGGVEASRVPQTKLPPFLKKLLDLTGSCPPHIGGWNEDGTLFVVRSSQFADLLREQFKATLQTFVRQLHFYSFNKKDDGKSGVWTFSHPSFLRGQPHLLMHIARKSNPKRNKTRRDAGGDDDDDDDHHSQHSDQQQSSSQMNAAVMTKMHAFEARLNYLERQVARVNSLESELAKVQKELTTLKDLSGAQDLLLLAPSTTNKKMRLHGDGGPTKTNDLTYKLLSSSTTATTMMTSTVTGQTTTTMTTSEMAKEEGLGSSSVPPLPKKVTRLTSVDSNFELRDFPFEDTSSVGSVSMRDMMRELQHGIFADFDELFAVPSQQQVYEHAPSSHHQQQQFQHPVSSTPMSDSSAELSHTNSSSSLLCKEKEESYFNIPQGFVLQAGVTMSLLRQTFSIIAKLCCPATAVHSSEGCVGALQKLCNDLPHPATLPPVEECDLSAQLLPILKDGVDEAASDLSLKRAARQVYEVYYTTIQKRLQEKAAMASANNTPIASVSQGCVKPVPHQQHLANNNREQQ